MFRLCGAVRTVLGGSEYFGWELLFGLLAATADAPFRARGALPANLCCFQSSTVVFYSPFERPSQVEDSGVTSCCCKPEFEPEKEKPS